MELKALLILSAAAAVVTAAPAQTDSSFDVPRAIRSLPHKAIKAEAQAQHGNKNVVYNENWAGVALSKTAGSFATVSATITVPTPTSTGGTAEQYGSAWVGIDGYSCQNAILQTGIEWWVFPNNTRGYSAWYEWYPDYAYNFANFAIAAGQVLVFTVVVSGASSTAGTAIIKNKSTGQTVVRQLSSNYALCGQDAEWIVEDYTQGYSEVPFSKFSPVTFTNSYAFSSGGQAYFSGQGGLLDIQQNTRLTISSQPDSYTVLVKHT